LLKIGISVIGDKYSTEQMTVDTVEACHGFHVIDNTDLIHIFAVGDEFRGGKIVDCFVHPESDCVFMVVECDGVYFDVYFDNYKKYDIQWTPLPFT
jgi:hypothetical protein